MWHLLQHVSSPQEFSTFFFGVLRPEDVLEAYQSRGQARLLDRVAVDGCHVYVVFQAALLFRLPQAHPCTLVYYQPCSSVTNIKPICNKCALQLYRFSLRAFSEDVEHCPRRIIPVQARGFA
jgi:hypothetical protein